MKTYIKFRSAVTWLIGCAGNNLAAQILTHAADNVQALGNTKRRLIEVRNLVSDITPGKIMIQWNLKKIERRFDSYKYATSYVF
ncbi:hypothetical protein [Dyadobacter alkalitolerans]|uniref:hypothetical protein n=1 Tax=Dyadobacter alkalitolerans TaxID=492736 RepID=UPI0003FFECCE|nr:hypothetical protein [Dyadobacter alkalitolerans]